jgi:hypothetical protein
MSYEVDTVASENSVANTNSAPLWLTHPRHKTAAARYDFPTGFSLSKILRLTYAELRF